MDNKAEKTIKILVIVGATATGKSNLAVKLAKKFSGEIISADSRQVYKGLDIGTGKITKKEMEGVPHHLLDVASPRHKFNAARYKLLAEKAISQIVRSSRLPIIVGGTGFYISVLLGKQTISNVSPNRALRAMLEYKSVSELANDLKKLDPKRALSIDLQNKRRLIRAIEITNESCKAKTISAETPRLANLNFNPLVIGLSISDDELKQKISKRLNARVKKGMIAEVHKLHALGLSWKRFHELGLEYRYVAMYLRRALSKQELIKTLENKIWQYAKRQKTWFKRDRRIHWYAPQDDRLIELEVKKFLA